MVREYGRPDIGEIRTLVQRRNILQAFLSVVALFFVGGIFGSSLPPLAFVLIGLIPVALYLRIFKTSVRALLMERERKREGAARKGQPVLGDPPQRDFFQEVLSEVRKNGKWFVDRYLVGFELDTGKGLWISDEEICTHACVFAKTGVGKTLWLESIILQQMARNRASGCTFIDAKRDSGTLAHIILMALVTGRIEDLIVIDPFDPVHSYNFVLTDQRADVKARKILRAGLPPTSDQSSTKHYDRLAADSVYRLVRALESMGLAWSLKDVGASLASFSLAYPKLREMLERVGAREAIVELGHLAASYRSIKGTLDTSRMTDNLRGIASELNSIAGSELGQIFCSAQSDLVLTDAIRKGKIIYYMLPRLEEAESANRMVKVFREDLEVSIGEVTSSRDYRLEDPHLVIIDEGSSTFGPTWANLFELARKGRFALLFGAQSVGGLSDQMLGLSQSFYERVMANVNLKVFMRIGDNRTAADMAEWMGRVNTTKTTMGAAVTTGKSVSVLGGPIDSASRRTGGESQTINVQQAEKDLVSPEELKHEMSAEKGLAWFDLGKGDIVKGRTLWVNCDIPDRWSGRDSLVRFERQYRDDVQIAEWIDERILEKEREDMVKLRERGGDPQVGYSDDRGARETSSSYEPPSLRQPPRRDDPKPPRTETAPPQSLTPEEKAKREEHEKRPFKISGPLRGSGVKLPRKKEEEIPEE